LQLVNSLESILLAEDTGYRFMTIAIFMQIIYLVSKSVGSSLETIKAPSISMGRAIGYLHRHFAETNVSIETLAKELNMSMSSLLRHFRRQNGCSPKEYLLKLRIHCACNMLQESNFGISEIAMRSGFDDSNYFSRQFRKVTGLSPREFRKISTRIVNT
jgi:AraC family L-rhamnose operon transcriptional activator RhaR/AraC family L-rhamnose operon regulatory protein RhaS